MTREQGALGRLPGYVLEQAGIAPAFCRLSSAEPQFAQESSATFALKAGEWFRRGRLLMVSPVHGDCRRCQAETPLIDPLEICGAVSVTR